MGTEAPPSQASCATTWTEARAWVLLEKSKEESAGQVPVEGVSPQGNAQQGRCRSIC